MPATKTHSRESTEPPSLSEAQYSRYNWYGDSAYEKESSNGDGNEDGIVTETDDGTSITKQKIESIVHSFLKQTLDRPLLDPIALFEDPEKCPYDCDDYLETGDCEHESPNLHANNGPSELTDPEVYPPERGSLVVKTETMERKAPSSRRWRYSEEFGHLSYGGIIPDRPAEQLLDDLPLVFNLVSVRVPPSTQEDIIEYAADLKSRGTLHDTQIMRRVARAIYDPSELKE